MRDYARTAKKITSVLFLVQSLSSAGFIAFFTVNALVGTELSGRASLAGVPETVRVLGQALAAMAWGYTMERIGRRRGLALGQMVGVLGSVVAGGAVIAHSFPLFLIGLLLVGMARASADLGRFAAAEVHLPERRGRAIANVVMGGTVGSVVGPLLVGPTGHLSLGAGLPELAGPYSVGFLFWGVAGILVFIGLRPDPLDIARELARLNPDSVPHLGRTRSLREIARQPGVVVAIVSVVFAQMVMVTLMVMTSVHMKFLQYPLSAVSLVIAAHTLGMYAFAILSGRLTDRWGRGPVIIVGSIILVLSCLMAAPSTALPPLLASLFLLGLGWNFAYVAGSTLLTDQLSPTERAKTQGLNDLLLGLASAAASLGSGVLFSVAGYGALGVTAASTALVPLGLALWWQYRGRLTPPAHVRAGL
ncbi:MAG TPA: MFS transporter [Candidatus Methylomirabilis sp.]|nr:MFS transporter [Candidatus Methylomirabilis sp.]